MDVANPRPHNWDMYVHVGIIINNLEVYRPSKIKAIRQTQNGTEGLVLLHTLICTHAFSIIFQKIRISKKETCLRERESLVTSCGINSEKYKRSPSLFEL